MTVKETAAVVLAISAILCVGASSEPLKQLPGQGASLYLLHCSGCHGRNGQGAPDSGVPRFDCRFMNILHHAEGKRYAVNVAGVRNAGLSDAEVSEVLNHLTTAFCASPNLSGAVMFSPDLIANLRDKDLDTVQLRKRIETDLKARGLDYPYYPW